MMDASAKLPLLPQRQKGRVPRRLKLSERHPPVTLPELALMLEIDLHLGRKNDFLCRLRAALKAVASYNATLYQKKARTARHVSLDRAGEPIPKLISTSTQSMPI